jgi:hypothetical protein
LNTSVVIPDASAKTPMRTNKGKTARPYSFTVAKGKERSWPMVKYSPMPRYMPPMPTMPMATATGIPMARNRNRQAMPA